jgi:hypothetical protein
MNYRLKDKKLSVDETYDRQLHSFIEGVHATLETSNSKVYTKIERDYTPFGRALMSLLTELTSPSCTSSDYINQKLGVLFEDAD